MQQVPGHANSGLFPPPVDRIDGPTTTRQQTADGNPARRAFAAATRMDDNGGPEGVVMRRVAMCVALLAFVVLGTVSAAVAQEKKPSVTSGWVKVPDAGATQTTGYVTVENPGMYAFYLISAASDAAATVELRQAGKEAAIDEITVPAYGSLDMSPTTYYIVLKGLKKPLAEGDKINLTVVNELSEKMSVEATVKKQ